jgi:hypothetical protein
MSGRRELELSSQNEVEYRNVVVTVVNLGFDISTGSQTFETK